MMEKKEGKELEKKKRKRRGRREKEKININKFRIINEKGKTKIFKKK